MDSLSPIYDRFSTIMTLKTIALLSFAGTLIAPVFSATTMAATNPNQPVESTLQASTASYQYAQNHRPVYQLPTQLASSQGSGSRLRSLALQLVNRDRQRKGLSRLTQDARLTQVAQRHAEDMIRKGYFSHRSLDGKTPTQRVRRSGSPLTAGENIIHYQATSQPKSARLVSKFQAEFMRSPGHRQNILKSDYSYFGYGIAKDSRSNRVVVVQLFGQRPY